MPTPPELPSVSVIMAVLDEAESIDGVVSDLLAQAYDGPLEVIVADGGSIDGTLGKLEGWAKKDRRLTVIHNPLRRQAPGLNLATEKASGEILVRADGHTRFAADYVRGSVNVLEETGGRGGRPDVSGGPVPVRQGGGGGDEEPAHDGPGSVPPFRHQGRG